MMKSSIRLAVVALAAMALMYGCGDTGSPTDPGNSNTAAFRAQVNCGDAGYLAHLSPVLPAWRDSIQTWLADPALLTATPVWDDGSTPDAYLAGLVPALQQWETAINGRFAVALLDTVANFDPNTATSTVYLTGLSSLLSAWEDSLETERGTAFLPDLPAYTPDVTAPAIVCIADQTVECADADGALVEFEITATDDCDLAPVVVCEPASGSVFPVGETVVTCTATDAAGNVSVCEFVVTVGADEPPVINRVSASPSTIWPPNHKWVNVRVSVDAEDLCDPELHAWILDVWSNEPVNGRGDGNTEPDWIVTGDLGLKVRAERAGNGSSRIYSVLVRIEDSAGNGEERVVEIVVPHDQGKK